jgi:hypothetical protein
MSHTKLDRQYCNRCDSIAARVGLRVFRSEFEEMTFPAWKTIKDAINRSSALFLLVGKELVRAQALSENSSAARESWKHTQNWISYEIGVACQRRIDVWVVCDYVKINFPVPYLNNYDIWGMNPYDRESLELWRKFFRNIASRMSCPVGTVPEKVFTCPNCGAVFNFHSVVERGEKVPCPTCLKDHIFKNGWLLDDKP